MSLNTVRFGASVLRGAGKKGILVPDSNGYYTMCVGGLNVFNSAGQWYTVEGARDLFSSSSIFMRRVSNKRLRGEVGHPKPLPGQSEESYINRIFEIDDKHVCVQFNEIWLDDSGEVKDKNGSPIIAIMAKLTPSGVHGDQLRRSLENGGEDVCFSIRAFTQDTLIRGIVHRELKTIVTFDQVNEPGISTANKFDSPTLESLNDKVFSVDEIADVCRRNASTGVATESVITISDELLSNLGYRLPAGTKAAFMDW
jgi:hypothetical protein